jgi:uncharacterized membrane protein
MTVTQSSKSSYPILMLDKRIINEPAVVLLGYLALAISILYADRTALQVWLAVLLAIFGSGSSTIAVLFVRLKDPDVVERVALSACLSMAIGGFLGFALSRSPWGLSLWPVIIFTCLYNLACYLILFFQRRNLAEQERFIRLDGGRFISWWNTDQSTLNRLKTAVLTLLLLAGAWMLAHQLSLPVMDPPMTEFYLLGRGGQTESYPKTGRPGETLAVTYGLVNRENQPASYQIKALIQGEEIGRSQPLQLAAAETQSGQIEFHLPDASSGPTKVDFVLYREQKPYRFLHLWINFVNPQPGSTQIP